MASEEPVKAAQKFWEEWSWTDPALAAERKAAEKMADALNSLRAALEETEAALSEWKKVTDGK